MANFFAKKAKAPAFMPVDGRGMFIVDSLAVAAAPVVADVYNFLIPAGMEVDIVQIQADDIDASATPTIVFRAGYRPATTGSGLAANDAYFAAAGQTLAQAGGRLNCAFKPIKFEEDVYLTITVNAAAATFAAGDLIAIVGGQGIGPK